MNNWLILANLTSNPSRNCKFLFAPIGNQLRLKILPLRSSTECVYTLHWAHADCVAFLRACAHTWQVFDIVYAVGCTCRACSLVISFRSVGSLLRRCLVCVPCFPRRQTWSVIVRLPLIFRASHCDCRLIWLLAGDGPPENKKGYPWHWKFC